MIGVVLLSERAKSSAVFWCEDQGELAFYDGSLEQADQDRFLEPGDLVEFDITFENKTRRAHNARLLKTSVLDGLQDELVKSASLDNKVEHTAPSLGNVVYFPAKAIPVPANIATAANDPAPAARKAYSSWPL